LDGIVVAEGIEDNDLVGPAQTFDAIDDVPGFVVGQDHRSQGRRWLWLV
jgi:hypothetical protein